MNRRYGASSSTATHALFSVVISTYCRPGLVVRAIESVRNQTHQRLEIIVVDNASPDNTADVVRAIPDGRIRYIRRDRNEGPSAARNTGILAASGEYIAFLDDDDEWRAEKLEKQVCVMNDFDVVLCGALVNGKGLKLHHSDVVSLDDLRRDNAFDPSSLAGKRGVFEQVPFDESLWHGEDWDQLIRIAQRYRIGYLRQPLIFYNDGSHDRITVAAKNLSAVQLEKRMLALEKHREFFGEYWIKYHIARSLLSYIGARENKWASIAYAVRKCGWLAVARVLLNKLRAYLNRVFRGRV